MELKIVLQNESENNDPWKGPIKNLQSISVLKGSELRGKRKLIIPKEHAFDADVFKYALVRFFDFIQMRLFF